MSCLCLGTTPRGVNKRQIDKKIIIVAKPVPRVSQFIVKGKFDRQQRQQRYYALIFCVIHSDPLNVRTDGRLFFLCLAIFPFHFLEHNCLQKAIIKISWVLEESIFMTRPSPRDFLKYAFKQNCRNCFKTIRIRDETYKLRSKLTLSSSGLIHFHPTSLSWGKYYLRRLIDGCAGLKVLGKTPVQDHHRIKRMAME